MVYIVGVAVLDTHTCSLQTSSGGVTTFASQSIIHVQGLGRSEGQMRLCVFATYPSKQDNGTAVKRESSTAWL